MTQRAQHGFKALCRGGNDHGVAALENSSSQPGEYRFGAYLHEHARARFVHGLNLTSEAHGLGQMAGEKGPDGRSAFLSRIRASRGVGVDRDAGGPQFKKVQVRGQPVGRRLHQGRVKRAGDGNRPDGHPRGLHLRHGQAHRAGRSGNDRLLRRVQVGDHHAGFAVQCAFHFAGGSRHRSHGAGVTGLPGGPLDGFAALGRDPEQVVVAQHARGGQGNVLAEAMPGGHGRLNAQPLESPAQCDLNHGKSGLRHHGPRDLLHLSRPPGFVPSGRWVDGCAEPPC